MELVEVIEAERRNQMRPLLPWCTAEPCIKLPLTAVLIDKERAAAYVTLEALAAALSERH